MNSANLTQEFVAESLEGLEQLDRDLVALEADPQDRERLDRIFRTVHNIKGACGFLGFARLEAVSHRGESLLSRLRDGRPGQRPEVTTALLALRQALKQAGFEVAEAGNGREGLESLGAQRPDLALVDWNMPVMDGLSFIRAVRAEPAYANLPLLMITTETELARVADALEAGANEYIMKPFTRDDLLAKLDLLGVAHG